MFTLAIHTDSENIEEVIEFRFHSFHSVIHILYMKNQSSKDRAQSQRERTHWESLSAFVYNVTLIWLTVDLCDNLIGFFSIHFVLDTVHHILQFIHWISSKSQFRMVLTSTSPLLFVPVFLRIQITLPHLDLCEIMAITYIESSHTHKNCQNCLFQAHFMCGYLKIHQQVKVVKSISYQSIKNYHLRS